MASARNFYEMIGIFTGLLLLLWIWGFPTGWLYRDWWLQLKLIGSTAGFLGYLFFSLSLFLSSRWKPLENLLGGLDRIYHYHHQLGILGFILLIIHPILLALRWIPYRVDKFVWFIFPIHERFSVNLGVMAWWLMIIIIGLTLLKALAYHRWKVMHKGMSLVFLIASAHIFLSEHKFAPYSISHYFVWIPFGLGLFGIIYKQIYLEFLAKKPSFVVVKTTRLNDHLVEITMRGGSGFNYIPGQYAFFSFSGKSLPKEFHPYTMLGNDPEGTLSVWVKARGDYTNLLYQNLEPGVEARAEGPYGRFDFRTAQMPQIWIAGGIGIALFIAWIRSEAFRYYQGKVTLFYCFHTKNDAFLLEELRHASKINPQFEFYLFCTEDDNRLDIDKMIKICGGFADTSILMCGPKRLTSDLKKQFISLGVAREAIYFEDFEFF